MNVGEFQISLEVPNNQIASVTVCPNPGGCPVTLKLVELHMLATV